MKVKSESEVAQSCPTLCDPMDCSLPGFSVHGIFQARVLEWGATAFSERLPRMTQKSPLCGIYVWPLGLPLYFLGFLSILPLPPHHYGHHPSASGSLPEIAQVRLIPLLVWNCSILLLFWRTHLSDTYNVLGTVLGWGCKKIRNTMIFTWSSSGSLERQESRALPLESESHKWRKCDCNI